MSLSRAIKREAIEVNAKIAATPKGSYVGTGRKPRPKCFSKDSAELVESLRSSPQVLEDLTELKAVQVLESSPVVLESLAELKSSHRTDELAAPRSRCRQQTWPSSENSPDPKLLPSGFFGVSEKPEEKRDPTHELACSQSLTQKVQKPCSPPREFFETEARLCSSLLEAACPPKHALHSQNILQPAHQNYVVGTRYCEERAWTSATKLAADEQLFQQHSRRTRSTTPRAARVAFTDRSLRLREGLQGRAAMDYSEVSAANAGNGVAHDASCSCASCKPFCQLAAGQFMNLEEAHRYHDGTHVGFAGSPSIDSSMVATVMKTMNEDAGSAAKASIGNPDVADQRQFRVELGSRIKAGERRSLSVDPAAGRHRKRGGFLQEDHHGVLEGSSRARPSAHHFAMQESDIAYVMTPRADDAICRHIRITSCKRGDGAYKYGQSKEAEKFLTHANEPLYRFEVKAVEDFERMPASVSEERRNSTRINPTAMESERSFLDDHATFRAGISNHSSSMSQALSHASAPKAAAMTRSHRLVSEPAFAELCGHVAEISTEGALGRRVNNVASSMADVLKWDA